MPNLAGLGERVWERGEGLSAPRPLSQDYCDIRLIRAPRAESFSTRRA
jgi:hypothetical protein